MSRELQTKIQQMGDMMSRELNTIRANMSGGGTGQYPSTSGKLYKPITVYRAVSELGKCGSDETVHWDWTVKMKDGLRQVCRLKDFLGILAYLGDPSTKVDGADNFEQTMKAAEEDHCVLQAKKDRIELGADLRSILLHSCGVTSEAFPNTKREKNGWTVWRKVTKWYLATSGKRTSGRMQAVMKPPQAKKDGEVLRAVARWQDEMADLRHLSWHTVTNS